MSAQPTLPPPNYLEAPQPAAAYKSAKPGKSYGTTDGADEPLLNDASGSSRAWMDQPGEDDLPDDFKIGVNVADCEAEIRLGFIRKVYSILLCQILVTTAISVILSLPGPSAFLQSNGWLMWIPMIGSFVSLFFVWMKRHSHPANIILLGLFTVFEAWLVGTVVGFYESRIAIQALCITLGVFVGLTLFTFQTKFDFSSLAPFLFAGLIGILTTSLVQIFVPFSQGVDLFVAGFSCLLFSGYILYDTQAILKRLSPDEYVIGALSLFLDLINLFLSILRVLNNVQER